MVDFRQIIDELKDSGLVMPNTVQINIPNAKQMLHFGLEHFVGKEYVWEPEYDEVVEWLSDNKGRGLLCYGNCGRGKTVICSKIIPVLLYHCYNKITNCYDAKQINNDFNQMIRKHIISIDDLGTEGEMSKYGEKKMCFPDIADEAEKRGKLLIISTNLTIEELTQKYGERTIDRLRSITRTVLFQGESLRK